MDITITITGTCAGGGHVFVDVTKDGVKRQEVFERGRLLEEGDDFIVEDERKAIFKEIKRQAREAGVKNFAQLKTLCTDLTIKI